jgi:hypothetical protein
VSQVGLITAVAPFTPFPFVHESKSGLLHTKVRLNANSLEASPTSWRPRLHLLKFREDMKDQPILVCRWQLTLGRVSGVIAGGSYWLTASDCRWSNLSDCFLSATGSQSRERTAQSSRAGQRLEYYWWNCDQTSASTSSGKGTPALLHRSTCVSKLTPLQPRPG